ncbi:Hypothetical predicted protein [Lecanosticta acicola]|uniref:Glycine zipper 2TM domain-containing protein n=1 Tax=Lecanosticta acicola TaxID=111012 RepID=A0AAI8YYJ7_9PEZI|nr:Hypothetical predicted protein [Lecanosticta acicola]
MSRPNYRSERYLEETITYKDQSTGERKRETRVRRLQPWEQESAYSDGHAGAAWMRSLRGEDAQNETSSALVPRKSEDQQLATPDQQDPDNDVASYRRRRVEKSRYRDHRSAPSDSGSRPRRREQQQQQQERQSQSQSRRKRDEDKPPQRGQNSNRSAQDSKNQDKNTKNQDKGNFLSRNFDSSFDGLLSAAAGAGIGAIGGRAFAERTDEGRKKYSTVTGAVAGALAANFAENKAAEWMREKQQDAEEGKDVNGRRTALEDCVEAAQVVQV